MADGSIIIQAEIDDKNAQAELNRLAQKIDNLNDKIARTQNAKLSIIPEYERLDRALTNANEKLLEMQNAPYGTYSTLQLAQQAETVSILQGRFNAVDAQLEKYDATISSATNELDVHKVRAAELIDVISGASNAMDQFGDDGAEAGREASNALDEVAARMEKLGNRILGVIKTVFIFSILNRALSSFRSWLSKTITSNNEAAAAIARLRGALLTLAQPIINVIIPAFTALVNIIAKVVAVIASFVSKLFGTTAKESAKTAENLDKESGAISGVGDAAKKASKQLASFDEINKLTGDDAAGAGGGGGGGGIGADFSGIAVADDWLDQKLKGIESKVVAGLLLGGLALIAIGASLGSLKLVLAGLLLIGTAIAYGSESGVFSDWAQKLGLDRAESLVTAGLLIAGMALIVFGIILGNLMLVLAGVVLLGAGIAYGGKTGVLSDWSKKLGLEKAESLVTAALLVAGIAAIVFGIVLGNIVLLIAGAAMIGAAIVYGGKNEVLSDWAKKLGLDKVSSWVSTALILVGIALVCFGAALGQLALIVAGAGLIGSGIAVDKMSEEELTDWWEKLKLTHVVQWVGVVTMLAGIALIAIGAAMANILMIIAGIALVGISTANFSVENGNLKDWVTVLGLQKVAGWVTTALLLGGIALLVIGIVTANAPMVLAGLGLLGAGISVGLTSGTFASWLDTIAGAWAKFKETILEIFDGLWSGIKFFINAILAGVELLANGVIQGINMAIEAINRLSFSAPEWVPIIGGHSIGFNLQKLKPVTIPRLAQGAVIPPNRAFLAMLGDQKSGTNIEAPLDTIVAAFRQVMGEQGNGGRNIILQLDRRELGRAVMDVYDLESQRIGIKLGGTI